MNIVIRFPGDWGNMLTKKIFNVPENANVEYLLERIKSEKGFPKKEEISLKIYKEEKWEKLKGDQSLESYGIGNESKVYLDIPIEENDLDYPTGQFYSKLGILKYDGDEEIKEVSEDLESLEDENDTKKRDQPNDQDFISNQLKQIVKDIKSHNGDFLKNYFDTFDFLKKFESELSDHKTFEETNRKKEEINKLLNDNLFTIGSDGWNSLHYAVFEGSIEAIQMLLKLFKNNSKFSNPDVNLPTKAELNPLQLAVHKNRPDVLKILLDYKGININKETKEGTVLHYAAKKGKKNVIEMLLNYNADTSIKDRNGKTFLDCCYDSELKAHLSEHLNKGKICFINGLNLTDVPSKCAGIVYKVGSLSVTLNERYLVLNPVDGTLIRFKKKEDFPLRPMEIVPLKDIAYLQRIGKSWYMKSDFYYFEFLYAGKQILACKHLSTVIAWINAIYKAAVYSHLLEGKLKDKNDGFAAMRKITQVDFSSEYEEILDIKRPEDFDNQAKFTFKPLIPIKDITIQGAKKTEEHRPNDDSLKSSPTTSMTKSNNSSETKEQTPGEIVNFKSFKLIRNLGQGAFGRVILVEKLDTGKVYAMKILKKKILIVRKQLKYAQAEANVLKQVNSPFIVKLWYAFQTPIHLYLIMEFCAKGDLSYYVAEKGKFSEELTRFYIAELILAVENLHSNNVVYRDLKPENILLDDEGHIKLADFGLCKEGIKDNDKAKSFCGSPAYLPPEALSGKGVGKAGDIYGIGTVMYELLVGIPPYYCEDIPSLYKLIQEGKLILPKELSEEAKSLLRELLKKDPSKRIGSKRKEDLKEHPFFAGIDWEKLMAREIVPPILESDYDEEVNIIGRENINFKDIDYDENTKKISRVPGWTFIRT